jgi:hypothetical protein
MCKCPGENAVTLEAGEVFIGCDIPPAPIEEILATVNVTNLEASLVNGVIEILGVVVVDIDGDSFTLDVSATVPIDTIGDHIKQKIAEFLGHGYTADDIEIEFVTKRAETGTIVVTVGGSVSPAHHIAYSIYLMLSLLLASILF